MRSGKNKASNVTEFTQSVVGMMVMVSSRSVYRAQGSVCPLNEMMSLFADSEDSQVARQHVERGKECLILRHSLSIHVQPSSRQQLTNGN